MFVQKFSTPSVSKEFSDFATASLNELPETVTDLLSQHNYLIMLGQSHSDIWKTFPRIPEAVGKVSPRLQQLINENYYESHIGLCLYFLGTPVITYTDNTDPKRDLILTHEIGHAIDHMFDPPLSDSPAFRAAYELDRKIARASVDFVESFAKLQIEKGQRKPNGASDKATKRMRGMLEIQLEDKTGPREIWANHFVHLMHGKPMESNFPYNFSNTLKVVRQQLEQTRIIAVTPEGSRIRPAVAPRKTNG